jgi:hypothetical protein
LDGGDEGEPFHAVIDPIAARREPAADRAGLAAPPDAAGSADSALATEDD